MPVVPVRTSAMQSSTRMRVASGMLFAGCGVGYLKREGFVSERSADGGEGFSGWETSELVFLCCNPKLAVPLGFGVPHLFQCRGDP